jgi:TPR repeat protein
VVATCNGNTGGRDWWNHAGQCGSRDQSGRGFYRRVVRRLATSRRRGSVCAFAVLALCGAQLSPSVSFANAPANASVQASADFDTALTAYQSGDMGRALRLGKSSANAGNLDAAVMVGHILRKGEAGSINLPEARRYFEIGAVRGHPDALVALGEMGLDGSAGLTDEDAYAYFLRASEVGRTDATLALAEMTRAGRGVAKSADGERELLERAIASFDKGATKRLADTYLETDPQRALALYEEAAEAGDADAAYAAGIMYAQAFDIRPNEERSAYWLGRAAQAGHPTAQADYGLLVYQGAGVPRDELQAADWFRQSAENGDTEGMFLYAFTLAKGEGVPQDFGESYYWLLKSGESTVDDYQEDRAVLRQRLEDNVDPEVLATASARFTAED